MSETGDVRTYVSHVGQTIYGTGPLSRERMHPFAVCSCHHRDHGAMVILIVPWNGLPVCKTKAFHGAIAFRLLSCGVAECGSWILQDLSTASLGRINCLMLPRPRPALFIDCDDCRTEGEDSSEAHLFQIPKFFGPSLLEAQAWSMFVQGCWHTPVSL